MTISPDAFAEFLPLLISLAIAIVFLAGLRWWMKNNKPANSESHLPRQLITIAAWALVIVLLLLSLPVSDATRGQLLSLLGLVLTALIALSSTSLVANAMAGLLLRIVDSFKPGDFIRVGEHFGRVSERGLFHTEVQTEDRDLLTLPNMHLITNPVTVVHDTGTIISATLSLGYELNHKRVEKRLKQAAKRVDLNDPFVQIGELGDFSVSYRVGGRLDDVSSLITARSQLRAAILDSLHEDGIEIVSPTYMNQRPQADPVPAIPPRWHESAPKDDKKVEDLVFDKAEEASQQQQRRNLISEIRAKLEQDKELKPKQLKALEAELSALEAEEQNSKEEKT